MRTCQAVVCAVLLQCEGDERPRLPAARCVLSTPTLLAEAAAAGTVRGAAGLDELVRSDCMALRHAASAVLMLRQGAWLFCEEELRREGCDRLR